MLYNNTAKTNEIKYWVSDLSAKAQLLLVRHCRRQLKQMGYDAEMIRTYAQDIRNEKLMNLEEIVSRELMIKYSQM